MCVGGEETRGSDAPLAELGTTMKRTSILAIGLVSITLTLPRPAWACCNDFWSCAGAVATAGASCLIREALDRLNALIQRVKNEIEATERAFESELQASHAQAVNEANRQQQLADLSARRLHDYVAEANRLAGNDKAALNTALQSAVIRQSTSASPSSSGAVSRINPGAVTRQGTPESAALAKPAVSSETAKYLLADNAIENLRRQIQRERDQGNAARERTVRAKQRVLELRAEASRKRSEEYKSYAIAPTLAVLAALAAATGNAQYAWDLAAIAAIVVAVDKISQEYNEKVAAQLERDAALLDIEVDKLKSEADAARQHEDGGRRLLAEMRKAVELKTVAERRALISAALAAPNVSVAISPIRLATARTSRRAALHQSFRSSLVLLRSEIQRLNMVKPAPDLSLARQRTTASFDQYFKGKTVHESRLIRDQLIAEARRIYGKDPNLRLAVEKLINAEAHARGVR